MNTQTRRIDGKAALNIINSRITLKQAMVGLTILARVQGIGNFMAAGDEKNTLKLDKWIHNLKAQSAVSMARPENKKLLEDAIALQAKADAMAGDASQKDAYEQVLDEVNDAFNAYLNAIQVSFNSIGADKKFNDGDTVTCDVELVDTKENGQQLVVRNVRYKAPTSVKADKFDFTDLVTSTEEAKKVLQNAPTS